MLNSIFRALQPRTTAYAHCDLPCGVYDPSQARLAVSYTHLTLPTRS